MKSLFKYFKGLKKECIMGPLFKLLEASFELLVPLVVARIIDRGIVNHDKGYVVNMCLVMILLAIIGLACSLTAQYFSAKAAVKFSGRLRLALFKHIMSLSYSDLDTAGSSTIITRMTADVNQLQNGVNMTLRLFLRSPFIVFGAMIMAFTIDARAALVFVVVIPLLALVIYGIMFITIPLNKRIQRRLERVLGDTRDNIHGVRVLRAFGQEDHERQTFKEDNGLLTKSQIVAGRIAGLTNPVTFVIINLGIIVLIYTGAVRVDSGVITNGELVALVNYMSQILVELIKLANFIVLDIKALASAARIEALFAAQSTRIDGDYELGADEHITNIEFDHVALKYAGASSEAVEDINFSLESGHSLGIVGATGSGKTTIVNMIPRFYEASRGHIRINGRDISEYSLSSLRRHIGVVPQKALLFEGTIRDNLRWGNEDASDEDIWAALAMARADEFVRDKEGGLDFKLSQAGKNLSGGQRQRLTIARALVARPDVIIFDDSASALDNLTEKALRGNIKTLEDTMVITVSQRVSSVMEHDQIMVLDDGQIAGQATHERLINECDIYREIYNAQFS